MGLHPNSLSVLFVWGWFMIPGFVIGVTMLSFVIFVLNQLEIIGPMRFNALNVNKS